MDCDAPPNSLMDSFVSPKVKTLEGEGVEAHSLAHNILRVQGMLKLRDGTKMSDKWVNYSHRLAQTKQQVG